MPDIVIRIPVSDEMAPEFEGKNVMVLPLSDDEVEQLPAALGQVARTLDANCRELNSARAKDLLKGPNEGAVTLMEFVHKLFGRSVLLGQKSTDRRLQ